MYWWLKVVVCSFDSGLHVTLQIVFFLVKDFKNHMLLSFSVIIMCNSTTKYI